MFLVTLEPHHDVHHRSSFSASMMNIVSMWQYNWDSNFFSPIYLGWWGKCFGSEKFEKFWPHMRFSTKLFFKICQFFLQLSFLDNGGNVLEVKNLENFDPIWGFQPNFFFKIHQSLVISLILTRNSSLNLLSNSQTSSSMWSHTWNCRMKFFSTPVKCPQRGYFFGIKKFEKSWPQRGFTPKIEVEEFIIFSNKSHIHSLRPMNGPLWCCL